MAGLRFQQSPVNGSGSLLTHFPGMAERKRGPGASFDVVGFAADGYVGAGGDLEVIIALGRFQHVFTDGVVSVHEVPRLAVIRLPAKGHEAHRVPIVAGVAV